jgi:restriction endonuclease S subunit
LKTILNSYLNIFYIYYILKYFIDYKNITTGSVIPKITKRNVENIKIPIPTNKELLNELDPLFKEVEELNENIEKTKIKYKKLIEELGNEAIIKD